MSLQRTTTQEMQRAAAAAAFDVAVIRCEGEMGEMELAQIGEELFRLANRGCRKVVLDLGGVDHLDYRGLRPLASRARLLRQSSGDLKLAGLSQYLAAILRAAGVDDEFELYRNADDAKAAFVQAPALAVVRR